MTIKAIETSYRGCRFRSRLEARWAVFFDTLNITWEYEPQGYYVGVHDRRMYLPDFWLPGPKTWVEVKGQNGAMDWKLLADACDWDAGLPELYESSGTTRGLLVLGPIPHVDMLSGCMHPIIQHHKGLTIAHATFKPTDFGVNIIERCEHPYCDWDWIVGDSAWNDAASGCTGFSFNESQRHLTEPGHRRPNIEGHDGVLLSQTVAGAYSAARSARFEHGQEGPYIPPTPPPDPVPRDPVGYPVYPVSMCGYSAMPREWRGVHTFSCETCTAVDAARETDPMGAS